MSNSICESVTVVIPAYNEMAAITAALQSVALYLSKHCSDWEIIVVDDGSSDDTVAILRDAMSRIPNLRIVKNGVNRGKGFSVRAGVIASRFSRILFTDADLSTPIEDAGLLMRELDNGADMAIASRYCESSEILLDQPFHRKLMGRVFNLFVKLFAVSEVKDSQCGFKAFKASVAKDIFSRSRIDGFCFDVELLVIAQERGYSFVEVPVRWSNCGHSAIRAVRDSVKMLFDVLKIKVYALSGRYSD